MVYLHSILSVERYTFLLVVVITVSVVLLYCLMKIQPSSNGQKYYADIFIFYSRFYEEQKLRGKSNNYYENSAINNIITEKPTTPLMNNDITTKSSNYQGNSNNKYIITEKPDITNKLSIDEVQNHRNPPNSHNINDKQQSQNHLREREIIKPFQYNYPYFSEEQLRYGKYKTIVQNDELSSIKEQSQRIAENVKNSMKFFWKGYETCAFGMDEIQPVTCRGINNWGGIGMTIVDCLDTLYIMDLKDEFNKAQQWLFDNLVYQSINKKVSHFEITIRVLGGLLSMYSLTKNEFYKKKSIELGDLLYSSFNEKLPYTGEGSGTNVCVAEAGTFQLEFNYLSKISDNNKYQQKAFETHDYLMNNIKEGLFLSEITSGSVGIGGNSDSIYEYILKVWIQTGKTNDRLRKVFNSNKQGIKNRLAKRSRKGILTVGKNGDPTVEHLSCFLPGLIALDIYHYKDLYENVAEREEEMEFAKSLMYTCYQMYMTTTTHLAPEIMSLQDEEIRASSVFNILRPEAVESLYVLHELTNDPIFLKWGWDIYSAFERSTKVRHGYSALNNVNIYGSHTDRCESFFGSETLKYLYLLFDTNKKVDLNKYVFNTEAHPFEM